MLPKTHPAWGDPLFSARFKVEPEDFQVTENLDFPFSGEGEHLYLRIEKIGRNTADVVNALKRCYKVPQKAIGVAGQKDRHAITSQWFSIVTPDDESRLLRWLAVDDAPPIRLLESVRHSRKLRIGAHSSNSFVVRLKDVRILGEGRILNDTADTIDATDATDATDLIDANKTTDTTDLIDANKTTDTTDSIDTINTTDSTDKNNDNQLCEFDPTSDSAHEPPVTLKRQVQQRLNTLAENGFPNYFGPQRFGRNGANITRALHWLTSSPGVPSMARDKRSLYLSAVRSAAFNRVLNARVVRGDWNKIRSGELCMLDGTHSVFRVTDLEQKATQLRANQFDVHPSAPLIGASRDTLDVDVDVDVDVDTDVDANLQDNAVLAEDPQHDALVAALGKLRVDASQRSTRAMCRDLQHRWLDNETIELSFTLAPGVFATTLLAEVFMERVA